MTTDTIHEQPNPPAPVAPPDNDDLPHPLTIFVNQSDRKRIVAALRRIHADRAAALLTALGLSRGDAS